MSRSNSSTPSALRKAFTLVEILVALAILLLLAALLFPLFNLARDNARTIGCVSNLRQINIAMQLYVTDNNGQYQNLESKSGCSWVDTLVPYTKSGAVFVCPAEPVETYEPGCGVSRKVDGLERLLNGGYVLNRPSVSPVMSQQRILSPQNFLLVMDGKPSDTQRFSVLKVNEPLTSEEMEGLPLAFRHTEMLNALFADGHVKKMSVESMSLIAQWHLNGR